MNDRNGFKITNRDRVLRAWENSTELVRDFQNYANEMKDDIKLAELFAEFSKDEGLHASMLLELLQSYDK